jgi:hypothetical protein
MFLLAFALLKFPLQHYITLSRFQHYGICLYVWSLGFFLQTIWSWRRLTVRGRTCLLTTGYYVATLAMIFYQNPWLDTRMAVVTEEQELLKGLFVLICGLFGFIVAIIWVIWIVERKPNSKEINS